MSRCFRKYRLAGGRFVFIIHYVSKYKFIGLGTPLSAVQLRYKRKSDLLNIFFKLDSLMTNLSCELDSFVNEMGSVYYRLSLNSLFDVCWLLVVISL